MEKSGQQGELSQKQTAFLGLLAGFCTTAGLFGVTYLASKKLFPKNQRKKQDTDLTREIERLKRIIQVNELTTADFDEKHTTQTGSRLSASELETMRAIFHSFDNNGNGRLFISDIPRLQEELGEPLSEDEAAQALHELSLNGVDDISFEDFLHWWYTSHKFKGRVRPRSKRGLTFKFKRDQINEFDSARVVVKPTGVKGARQFRVKFYYQQGNKNLKQISPWHDVPLYQNEKAKIFNFICEIPKWTRCKYEIATGEEFNPIKQDVKNGKLRNYKHGDMMFNYGAFPQTWEDPQHISEDTKYPGDNDPIDVLELGSRQLNVGEIAPVKILGVLALIDSKETDWKIIAININDPLAHDLHDVHDVETKLPGAIDAIREYLRIYKCWSGADANEFGFNEECMLRDFAIQTVEECHEAWRKLMCSGKRVV